MNKTLFIIIICILGLYIYLYNTMCLKQKMEEFFIEKFENQESTLSMFNSGYDFHRDSQSYSNFPNLKDVKHDYPLLTFGCIQHKPNDETIHKYLNENFFVSTLEFFSLSFNDIADKILQDVKKNKIYFQEKQEIDTPIYIIIYQSPFFKVHDRHFHIREDILIDTASSFEMKGENVDIGKREIFTKIHIVYTGYVYYDDEDKILKKKNGNTIFRNFMKDKIKRNKLCQIKCNNSSLYECGCMNKSVNNNNSEYESTCVDINNKKYDYAMIYTLNKYNNLFQSLIK